jgi:hypothetical protein
MSEQEAKEHAHCSDTVKKTIATATKKKTATKGTAKKNKLGVKNSLVNHINVHKKKGDAHSKKDSTVSKKAYKDMENHLGEKK